MREKGFTIIELMIALVLGLILIGAALSLFVGTKQGYRLGQGMTLMQSTGRATMDFLAREISMAGFPQSSAIESFVAGETSDGSGSASDQFAVLFRSDTDCLNAATPVYADGVRYAKNKYFIQNNGLVCRTLAEDGSTLAEATIVQGIENMQLLYGEDANVADGVTNATKYVTAGNVTDWSAVVSVRLGLLVSSQDVVATTDDAVSHELLGQTPVAAAGDKLRRRAYSSTVVIRNRMQGS